VEGEQAQVAKMRGKFGADLQTVVDQLVTPAVDWRAALARFASESAQADYSWSIPNRRFTHLGLYLPALHSRRVGDAVFVRDSSGSVFDETQRQFASEIHRVFDEVKPSRLIVIDCDARVTQVQVFEPGDALELAPVKGGGGTCFAPPFEWVEEQGFRPAFLAYLTDMYGTFPEVPPEYPVLWASTTPLRRIHTPPFGDCIEVIV
jgi:predicted metal-dependent peptidase